MAGRILESTWKSGQSLAAGPCGVVMLTAEGRTIDKSQFASKEGRG